MKREEIFALIVESGIVPVVRTESAAGAIQAIQAIYRGGIRAAEITMTVPGAIQALEKVADEFGDRMVLGAGTVLDPETARACMLAGAVFFVTPSLKLSTIEMVKRYSKVMMPGALTPTEILTAWEAGADAVKVFPCGNVGGAKYIKSVKTAPEFLKAGACAVGVGAELIDSANIRAGKFEVFEHRARHFLEIIAKARAEMGAAFQKN
jgi:2-dehydro-3-deoxyphosphogluconate aldolase/(4S)-4-hydroxy-2-oxoglutarate aldolase